MCVCVRCMIYIHIIHIIYTSYIHISNIHRIYIHLMYIHRIYIHPIYIYPRSSASRIRWRAGRSLYLLLYFNFIYIYPRRSASRIRWRAGRSFTEPPGFMYSACHTIYIYIYINIYMRIDEHHACKPSYPHTLTHVNAHVCIHA